MEGMDATWLNNSKKMVYVGQRWFLTMEHPHCKNKKSFNGNIEDRPAPQTLNGKQTLTKVNKLKVILRKGKGSVQALRSSTLKKKSIF